MSVAREKEQKMEVDASTQRNAAQRRHVSFFWNLAHWDKAPVRARNIRGFVDLRESCWSRTMAAFFNIYSRGSHRAMQTVSQQIPFAESDTTKSDE